MTNNRGESIYCKTLKGTVNSIIQTDEQKKMTRSMEIDSILNIDLDNINNCSTIVFNGT